MKQFALSFAVLLTCLGCTFTANAQAIKVKAKQQEETKQKATSSSDSINRFIRISRDGENNPIGMETSTTRYVTRNSKGERVTVDLIGVVHIGEKGYYEKLNKQFEKYDALLFELVAPKDTVIPKGGGGGGTGMNPVAMLQMSMKSALGLQFQLEHIDYTVDNFVHADMTPEEFAESMKKNNESVFKMALKALGQGIAKQSKGNDNSDTEMMMAMFSRDKPRLRKAMAEQMLDMESGMVIFQGKDGSTIINHRNTKALEVMRQQIEAGKTHIGVFYGAGHLPDMEETLMKSDGMKRGGTTWLKAWDLESK